VSWGPGAKLIRGRGQLSKRTWSSKERVATASKQGSEPQSGSEGQQGVGWSDGLPQAARPLTSPGEGLCALCSCPWKGYAPMPRHALCERGAVEREQVRIWAQSHTVYLLQPDPVQKQASREWVGLYCRGLTCMPAVAP